MESPAVLVRKAVLRLVVGVLVLGAVLFGLAGSLRYWPGWVFLAVLVLPMGVMLAWLARHDPALLERRLQLQEERTVQKRVIGVSQLLFGVGFLVPGLDWRYGWSRLPAGLILAANAGVLAAYLLNVWVLRTNSYASRIIEVQTGQQLVDTGPYAIVRHPMYAAVSAMMLCSGLALGSVWATLAYLPLPWLLAARVRDEEAALREGLPGYAAYCERVRWRLLPGVW